MRMVQNDTDVILTAQAYTELTGKVVQLEQLQDQLEAKRLRRRPYNRRYMREYMRKRRAAENQVAHVAL